MGSGHTWGQDAWAQHTPRSHRPHLRPHGCASPLRPTARSAEPPSPPTWRTADAVLPPPSQVSAAPRRPPTPPTPPYSPSPPLPCRRCGAALRGAVGGSVPCRRLAAGAGPAAPIAVPGAAAGSAGPHRLPSVPQSRRPQSVQEEAEGGEEEQSQKEIKLRSASAAALRAAPMGEWGFDASPPPSPPPEWFACSYEGSVLC